MFGGRGGGSTPSSSRWCFPLRPSRVGEVFVPLWLDSVEFKCFSAIRAVEFCSPELDPVMADVL